MITIESLIGRAINQLRDPQNSRWALAELCDYYNDAVRAVILLRPDAGARNVVLTTEPGQVRQTLPAGAISLLAIDATQDGRTILPVSRDELNAAYPDWRTERGAPERYLYEPSYPLTYSLYPASDEAVSIEAVVCAIPDPVILANLRGQTPLTISDAWINPLLDWILYRAFSKDSDQGSQLQLAMQHYQAFTQQLGGKTQADGQNNPAADLPGLTPQAR